MGMEGFNFKKTPSELETLALGQELSEIEWKLIENDIAIKEIEDKLTDFTGKEKELKKDVTVGLLDADQLDPEEELAKIEDEYRRLEEKLQKLQAECKSLLFEKHNFFKKFDAQFLAGAEAVQVVSDSLLKTKEQAEKPYLLRHPN